MKAAPVSLPRAGVLLSSFLSGAFMCTGVQAAGDTIGWIEQPDFDAFRIIRNGVAQPAGQAELQACDIVQLKTDAATVRITLPGYPRLQLDATAPDQQMRVPCTEKAEWYGKPLAVLRAIAGLATAPAMNLETVLATRSLDKSPRLLVPALGDYDPLLVAGERSLYITWTGGVAPYTVTLHRDDGGIVVERTNIRTTSVRLPKAHLEPGRYVLLIEGGDKNGIKEDNITVVDPSRLPPPPKPLADARLARADHELLYAYYLEGSGHGEWTFEALQRAAAIHPATPAVNNWLRRRFSWEGGKPP
jgi:hypothetical protein